MAASKVVLIFGSGANVGAALVKGFIGAGYRVATVSRSAADPPTPSGSLLAIRADASRPAEVKNVFSVVAKAWTFPSVVIWNAAHSSRGSDSNNPFSVSEEAFDSDLNVMIKSPFIAAGEAVKAWSAGAGDEGQKTFIMTGNLLPKKILPIANLTMGGVGKSGAAYWVGTADALYKDKGFRFFFADERTPQGGPVGSKPDGEGHFEVYSRLAEGKDTADLDYYVTFLKGKYHKFE